MVTREELFKKMLGENGKPDPTLTEIQLVKDPTAKKNQTIIKGFIYRGSYYPVVMYLSTPVGSNCLAYDFAVSSIGTYVIIRDMDTEKWFMVGCDLTLKFPDADIDTLNED